MSLARQKDSGYPGVVVIPVKKHLSKRREEEVEEQVDEETDGVFTVFCNNDNAPSESKGLQGKTERLTMVSELTTVAVLLTQTEPTNFCFQDPFERKRIKKKDNGHFTRKK